MNAREMKTGAVEGAGLHKSIHNIAATPDQESAAEKRRAADAKAKRSRSTSTDAQFARIVAKLREGPQTTYALRKLGIAQTSSRIWDLRARGYVIDMQRVEAYDSDGYLHFGVARYSLLQEPLNQVNDSEVGND